METMIRTNRKKLQNELSYRKYTVKEKNKLPFHK